MSDDMRSKLASDMPFANKVTPHNELTNQRLSLAGNIMPESRIKSGNSSDKSGKLLLASDDTVSQTPVAPDSTSDTTQNTGTKKTKVLQGSIEHSEKRQPTEPANPRNGQVEDTETPKPIMFYREQGRIDDSAGKEFDDKFLELVSNKLMKKLRSLAKKTITDQFPIPEGSSISISCTLDRNAHVSNLKVEDSSHCEQYDQLLLQSVKEVDSDGQLRFPASIVDNERKENCDFELASIKQRRSSLLEQSYSGTKYETEFEVSSGSTR